MQDEMCKKTQDLESDTEEFQMISLKMENFIISILKSTSKDLQKPQTKLMMKFEKSSPFFSRPMFEVGPYVKFVLLVFQWTCLRDP